MITKGPCQKDDRKKQLKYLSLGVGGFGAEFPKLSFGKFRFFKAFLARGEVNLLLSGVVF